MALNGFVSRIYGGDTIFLCIWNKVMTFTKYVDIAFLWNVLINDCNGAIYGQCTFEF